MKKKIISMMLSVALVISSVPATNVSATEVAVESVDVADVAEIETVNSELHSEETDIVYAEETYSLADEYELFNIAANGKAVGSDGVLYDNVAYLSAETVALLPDDAQKEYVTLCDEIAAWNEAGRKVEDVVIATDGDGNLHASFSFPMGELDRFQNEMNAELAAEVNEVMPAETEEAVEETTTSVETEEAIEETTTSVETEEAIEETTSVETEKAVEETTTDVETEEATEEETTDAETEEAVEEETTDVETEEATEEETTDVETEEATEEETTDVETEEATEEETTDVETEEATEEETTDAETEEATEEETTDAETEELEIQEAVLVSENMEFLAEIEEETFEVAEDVVVENIIDLGYGNTGDVANINSTLRDKKHFYNQLNSAEKVVYDSAYKSMTAGKNSFSFKARFTSEGQIWTDIFQGVSAVVMTKPTAGEWMDKSQDGQIKCGYTYYLGNPIYNFTVKIDKSKHYKSNLNKEANKKIEELALAAQDYAAQNYPKSPVYGIVKYFDKWVCENNYYSDAGLHPEWGDVEEYFYCHSSYGILLKGYGVCESYALAMTKLLDAVGIPNMYVVGDVPGGGHAWNYVQMPDGKWYLLDSTWNDPENQNATSTGDYLLCADDKMHYAVGNIYVVYRTAFKFADLSNSDYKPQNEAIKFEQSTYNIKPKDKVELKCNSSYITGLEQTWKSSNTKVAKVDKNGKVTAVKPGTATITLESAGLTASATINVHKVDKVTFAENKKTSYSLGVGISEKSMPETIVNIDVTQNNKITSASELVRLGIYEKPECKSSNETVAVVKSAAVSGDVISLKIQPKSMGKAKITLNFAGKKLTLNYTVKQEMSKSWFTVSAYPNDKQEYTGTAFKPAVTINTAKAPANFKKSHFKIVHKNNKNVGLAEVWVTGKGNYAGDIMLYDYNITAVDIKTGTLTKATASKIYNGAAQVPSTTVKLGKKKLSSKNDYTVKFRKNGNGNIESAIGVGDYKIVIVGKGNYSGEIVTDKVFTIKPAKISSLKVSCAKTVKYTGKEVYPVMTVKLGKNKLNAYEHYDVKYYKADDEARTKAVKPKEKGKYIAVVKPLNQNIVETATKKDIVKKFTVN